LTDQADQRPRIVADGRERLRNWTRITCRA